MQKVVKVLVKKPKMVPIDPKQMAAKIKKAQRADKGVLRLYSDFDKYVNIERNKMLRLLKGIESALSRKAVSTTCTFPVSITDFSAKSDRNDFQTKSLVDGNGNNILKAYRMLRAEFDKAGYVAKVTTKQGIEGVPVASGDFWVTLHILGVK